MPPVRTTYVNANGTIHLREISPPGADGRYLCGRSTAGGMILAQTRDLNPYVTCTPCKRRHDIGETQSAVTTRRRILANRLVMGLDDAGMTR